MTSIGILGLGSSLPAVRPNDFWPGEVVRAWEDMRVKNALRGRDFPGDLDTTGARLAKAAMASAESDAFFGAVERRALGPSETTLEHELRAVNAALQDAKRVASDVDFVLVHSTLPASLLVGNGPALHAALGLAEHVRVVSVEAVFNSFQVQLDLARMMIASGDHRCGLLVQSSGTTRLIPREDPASALFGDGATAQIVSKVSAGRGVLAMAHLTDGSVYRAAVVDNPEPGRGWWDEGRTTFHIEDPAQGRKMFLGAADIAARLLGRALLEAGLDAREVDFFAGHQSTSWFARVLQEASGLAHARTVTTFPFLGNVGASNLPMVLEIARKQGTLRDGDLVAMLSGGSGQNVTGGVMRWGR